MPAGRPTKYTPELIEDARAYVDGGWEVAGDKVPSIAGMACELGVSRESLRLWAADETKEFFGILEQLDAKQERALLAGGLSGDFSGPISKLMLHRHGYSDKIEQDHTSRDGSMTPTAFVIEGVAPPDFDEPS